MSFEKRIFRQRAWHWAALLIAALLPQLGCKSGPQTSLQLWGTDSKSPDANYSFNQTLWRTSSVVDGGVEFIGYGMMPFNNGPMSPVYDPRWPPSGWVTYYMHLVPEAAGRYALTILGPAAAIGPGDNEVLTGVIEHPKIASTAKGDLRTITINDKFAIHSRNHPKTPFTMSGTIIAKPGSQGEFDRELHTFEQQLSWRGPAPSQ